MEELILEKSAKPSSMTDDDWIEFDLKVVSNIQLCLAAM